MGDSGPSVGRARGRAAAVRAQVSTTQDVRMPGAVAPPVQTPYPHPLPPVGRGVPSRGVPRDLSRGRGVTPERSQQPPVAGGRGSFLHWSTTGSTSSSLESVTTGLTGLQIGTSGAEADWPALGRAATRGTRGRVVPFGPGTRPDHVTTKQEYQVKAREVEQHELKEVEQQQAERKLEGDNKKKKEDGATLTEIILKLALSHSKLNID